MIISVDLGGTNVRGGLYNKGVIVEKRHEQLRDVSSRQHTLDQVTGVIQSLMSSSVKGIGIAVPSVVDKAKGIVYNVVNIPSWECIELKKILEDCFHVSAEVDNDANCFALGSYHYELLSSEKNMVGITLGTGMGTGIIAAGKLYAGNNCGAGEIGYLPYRDHDLEYYCSSTFFSKIHSTTGYEAYLNASKGNQDALQLWREFGVHLGHALKAVVYAYDPGAIILGGSISQAFSFFELSMVGTLHDKFHFPQSLKKLRIIRSVNDDVLLLGAAALLAK